MKKKRMWIFTLCFVEEEGPTENEVERRKQEERAAKAKLIIGMCRPVRFNVHIQSKLL